MKYRVTSLQTISETLYAVLEDDTPERNWTDIQCGVTSPFAKTVIAAHTAGMTLTLQLASEIATGPRTPGEPVPWVCANGHLNSHKRERCRYCDAPYNGQR